MASPIFVGLLLAAGVALAYKFSAVVAARKKADAALEPFRSLRNELASQTSVIKNGVSQAAQIRFFPRQSSFYKIGPMCS